MSTVRAVYLVKQQLEKMKSLTQAKKGYELVLLYDKKKILPANDKNIIYYYLGD